MGVTIKVNGSNLSLAHKGSGGIIKSTVPDVCKTPMPGGPVPIPYTIVSRTANLINATKSVKVDGGFPAAHKTSKIKNCVGDEPGTAGGVKSGTQLKAASWLSWSNDVFFEGQNACRLGDKLLMNNANAACLGGLAQAPVEVQAQLQILCGIICECDKIPVASSSGDSDLKQLCVKMALLALDNALQNGYDMKPEIPYNMTTSPPTPLLQRNGPAGNLMPSSYLPKRMEQEGLLSAANNGGIYQVRIPDVIIVRDLSQPLVAGNLSAVVEIKFNNQTRDATQIQDYERIAGDPNRVVELNPKECDCKNRDDNTQPDPVPVVVPAPEPEEEDVQNPNAITDGIPADEPGLQPTLPPGPAYPPQGATPPPAYPPVGGGNPIPQPAFSLPSMDDVLSWEYWEEATGLTGLALVLYLVVSEGSRLYPPRNLVPVP